MLLKVLLNMLFMLLKVPFLGVVDAVKRAVFYAVKSVVKHVVLAVKIAVFRCCLCC